MAVCRAPDASLGFGSILEAAAASFKQLYPGEKPPFFASGSAGALLVMHSQIMLYLQKLYCCRAFGQ